MFSRWKTYIKNLKKIGQENLLLKKNNSFLIRERYQSLINNNSTTSAKNINENEFNVYSQNGEDGILLYLLSKIGTYNYTIIEFGASDGVQCNSANLLINFRWKALLIEGNHEKVKYGIKYYKDQNINSSKIKFINSFITTENINDLFIANGFTNEIDILSIDIDGNDYHVWNAINSVNPRIIVVEYNSAFGPVQKITIPYNPTFTLKSKEPTGFYFGASLAALEKLGKEKGYSLIGTDSFGVNAFFVRNDLIKEHFPVRSSEDCFHENLKCKSIGGHLKAFEKISHLEFVSV